jgi:hypothetical protein
MARELTTDLAVLERFVALEGSDVLDVGCGSGALVRELAARGARAVGMEISEDQLGDARRRAADGTVRYVVGSAQALPLDDRSFDAVVFMRSLHHVPRPAMGEALAQAARVLAPGGVIYVAEPLTEGGYWELVRIVDDETAVRGAAQAAIETAARGMGHVRHEYAVGSLSSLERLRERVVAADPDRAAVFDARSGELAEAFARLGEPREHGRWFVQPMRADVLTPGAGTAAS